MVCPQCGKDINKDAAFCRFCGASLGRRKRIKKLWLILVPSICLVLAAAVIVLGPLAHGAFSPGPSPTPSPAPTLAPTAAPTATPTPTPAPSPTPTPTLSPTPAPTPSAVPTPEPTLTPPPTEQTDVVQPPAQNNDFLTTLYGFQNGINENLILFLDHNEALSNSNVIRDEAWAQRGIEIGNTVKAKCQEVINYNEADVPNKYKTMYSEYKAGCSSVIDAMNRYIDAINGHSYDAMLHAYYTLIEGYNQLSAVLP